MLDIDAIYQAQTRLTDVAIKTPLFKSRKLDEQLEADIWLKCENFQHTGSFKFRGAYNTISLLPVDKLKNGVVACSSGNHAQGVAAAAKMFGVKATIVMPQDAPIIKLERTKELGATVITYNRDTEDREAIAKQVSSDTGANFIHPYDNFNVMAGQGTSGLEAIEQLKDLGKMADLFAICCGEVG